METKFKQIKDIELNDEDMTTLKLTMSEPIAANTTVKVAYAQGTIQSAAGGYLSDFNPKLVANNVTGVNNLDQNFNIYGFYNRKNRTIDITLYFIAICMCWNMNVIALFFNSNAYFSKYIRNLP